MGRYSNIPHEKFESHHKSTQPIRFSTKPNRIHTKLNWFMQKPNPFIHNWTGSETRQEEKGRGKARIKEIRSESEPVKV